MAEKDVLVKVVLHAPGSNPPYHFESNDVPIDGNNVIYFSNCGKYKGFMVYYELDDTNNANFRFPTRQTHGNGYLDEALWVSQSGGCPTRPSNWSVFEAKGEEQNGRTLIVRNKNKDVEDFAYTLRVANGANWLDLDPGGKNQNGGIPLAHRAIGPVTGLIVGLGAASLASYALEPSGMLLLGLGGLVVGFLVALVLDQL